MMFRLVNQPLIKLDAASKKVECCLCESVKLDCGNGGEELVRHLVDFHKIKNPARTLFSLFNGSEFHYQTMTNSGLTAPVTIPLRAALAARSSREILSYLTRVEHTVTLWGGATDQVDLQLLSQLVRDVGADRVYVDVPFQYNPPPLHPTQRQTRRLHNLLINSINSALSLFASIL